MYLTGAYLKSNLLTSHAHYVAVEGLCSDTTILAKWNGEIIQLNDGLEGSARAHLLVMQLNWINEMVCLPEHRPFLDHTLTQASAHAKWQWQVSRRIIKSAYMTSEWMTNFSHHDDSLEEKHYLMNMYTTLYTTTQKIILFFDCRHCTIILFIYLFLLLFPTRRSDAEKKLSLFLAVLGLMI